MYYNMWCKCTAQGDTTGTTKVVQRYCTGGTKVFQMWCNGTTKVV